MAHAKEGVAEDGDHFSWLYAEDEAGEERGQEAACAGGSEPVEIEFGVFGGWLDDYGRCAENGFVKIGNFPATGFEGGSGRAAHGALDGGQSPEENEDGENGEGQPRFGGLSSGVATSGSSLLELADIPFVGHGVQDDGT